MSGCSQDSRLSAKPRIKALPAPLVEQLRAGVKIVSPTRCVEELVFNSIDAGADCVAVRVDLKKRWKIVVLDNGPGILPADLQNVGTRYYTSKCDGAEDLDGACHTYGYRGDALNSVANVSGMLEVTSKCASDPDAYARTFWHGRPWRFEKAREPRATRGTTVTVVDFFYNLPVRRKAMKPNLELDYMKGALERIAVVHPHLSLSLKDEDTGETLFSTVKCSSVLQSFLRLFGDDAAREMRKLKYKQGKMRVEGFIRLRSFTDPRLRLLYVNKILLRKSRLNKYVDSAILKEIFAPESAKYPVYILNIRCPWSFYEITQESRQTCVEFADWEAALNCIKEGVTKFFDELKEADDEALEDVERDLRPLAHAKELEVSRKGSPVRRPVPENREESPNVPVVEASSKPSSQAPVQEPPRPASSQPETVVARRSKIVRHASDVRRDPANASLESLPTALMQLSERAMETADSCSTCYLPKRRKRTCVRGLTSTVRAIRGTSPDWNDADSDDEIALSLRPSSSKRTAYLARFANPQKFAEDYHDAYRGRDAAVSASPLRRENNEIKKLALRQEHLVDRSCQTAERSPPPKDPADRRLPEVRGTVGSSRDDACFEDESSSEANPCEEVTNLSLESKVRRMARSQESRYLSGSTWYSHRARNSTPQPSQPEHPPEVNLTVEPQEEAEYAIRWSDEEEKTEETPPPSFDPEKEACPESQLEKMLPVSGGGEEFDIDLCSIPRLPPTPVPPDGILNETVGNLNPDAIDVLLTRKLSGKGKIAPNLRQDPRICAPDSSAFPAVNYFDNEWDNPAFMPGRIVELTSSGPKDSVAFSKKMLENVQVVGQADAKFIIAVMTDERETRWLVAVDQHAAHERIRLESLVADNVLHLEGKKWALRSRVVDPALQLKLPARLWKVIQATSPASFARLGFVWTTVKENGDCFDVSLAHVPAVFVDRNAREVRKGSLDEIKTLCVRLIEEAVEKTLSKDGAASWSVPETVMGILASRACKGAIKFFDPLTRAECAEIIQSLRKCALPFQCAHGRPSMVPLINLTALHGDE